MSPYRLLEMVKDCFGIVAKSSVEEVRAEQLPAILLVYKMKGSLDIRNIIQGMKPSRVTSWLSVWIVLTLGRRGNKRYLATL